MNGLCYTTREAADALNLSGQRIQQLIHAGLLTGVKVAGRWRITPASVEAYRQNPHRWGAPKPWLAEALERCTLTPQQRAVCEAVAGGLSQAEVGRALGVSRAAVHAKLKAARRRLCEAF